MTMMLDISPKTNLIRSYRGDKIDYVLLVGEGVDNALDASASAIAVTVERERVSFEDNGEGVTEKRIESLFSLGDHAPMAGAKLGRFGIGIKAQAINAGDIFEVTSTSIDGRVRAVVDWGKLLRSGVWKIQMPRWLPSLVNAPTGTLIEVLALRKPPLVPLERLYDELAARFYPAIAAGKLISLNGRAVQCLADPAMTDCVERTFELSGRRSAHLRAGILEKPGKLHGIHVAYEHRVIMPAASVGCKEFGGVKRLFGRLQVSGPWHLARFKDGLTDEAEFAELDDAVFAVLRPLLEKISAASIDARLLHLAQNINDLLPDDIAARPKRTKTEPAAAAKKRGPAGGTTQKARDVGEGPAVMRKPPNARLLITFDGNAEEDGVGAYKPGRPQRVELSKDDPTVAHLIALRDQDVAAKQLLFAALLIYENGRTEHEPELPLESFGKRVSKLLAVQGDESKAISV